MHPKHPKGFALPRLFSHILALSVWFERRSVSERGKEEIIWDGVLFTHKYGEIQNTSVRVILAVIYFGFHLPLSDESQNSFGQNNPQHVI